MIATDFTINLFARRLYEAERTLDNNIKLQKMMFMLKGTEAQKITFTNLINKWDDNIPFMMADKSLATDEIFEVIQTGVQYVGDKLMDYKHDVWNEVMTFFGKNNTNTDKRERLTDNEVEANNEQIELSADVMLLTRKEAALDMNKKFGLNVSVELRSWDEAKERKEEEDGEIHD